ncbi:hypothetical protein EHM69_05685 [candidate division KSB1 bacterium]|nr:MAG: hypothetical protein EHM69_05685 [candidate division KSB1 bacterium]
MKYIKFIVCAVAALAMCGCGLVSGTLFVSQDIEGSFRSSSPSQIGEDHNPGTLDSFGSVRVYLKDNEDWKKIDIEGLEDICVRVTVTNYRSEPMSGEIWVTTGDTQYQSIAEVQEHGFRVFSGLALLANGQRTFTCAETIEDFENLDRLTDAVREGVFRVWGRGDQATYDIGYDAIYLGMHVTGSL